MKLVILSTSKGVKVPSSYVLSSVNFALFRWDSDLFALFCNR